MARMVLLHHVRARFHEPVRYEAARDEPGPRPHLRRGTELSKRQANTSETNCGTLMYRSGTAGTTSWVIVLRARTSFLTTCLVWAIESGVGVYDNVLPYLARVTSRPAYTKSVAVNAVAI